MTTEREHLTLAAKACGITGTTDPEGTGTDEFYGLWRDDGAGWWVPHTDDGDCARMEAALGINVMWFDDYVDLYRRDIEHQEYFSNHNSDKNAARRAASVAVAADIGRMK